MSPHGPRTMPTLTPPPTLQQSQTRAEGVEGRGGRRDGGGVTRLCTSLRHVRTHAIYLFLCYCPSATRRERRERENVGEHVCRLVSTQLAHARTRPPHTPAHGTSVLCSQYVPRTLALAPRTRSDLLPDLTQRISPSAHAGGCLCISLRLGLATPLAPLPSSRHHLRPQLAQGSETHLGLDASDSRCNCRARPRLCGRRSRLCARRPRPPLALERPETLTCSPASAHCPHLCRPRWARPSCVWSDLRLPHPQSESRLVHRPRSRHAHSRVPSR